MKGTLLVLAALAHPLLAAKDHDFKKCHQSGFCKRGRALSERAVATGTQWHSPYSVDSSSVGFSAEKSSLRAPVKSELYPGIKFELQVDILEDGVARVRLDEKDGLRQRYNEAASWALVTEPKLKPSGVSWSSFGSSGTKALFDGVELRISYSPLQITLLRDGREEVVLNGRGLLHMEHHREKNLLPPQEEGDQAVIEDADPKVNANAWFEGETEESYWEEKFNTWTDTKPKGAYISRIMLISSHDQLIISTWHC